MLKRKVLGFIALAALMPFILVLTGCGNSSTEIPAEPNTDWYTSNPSAIKFFIGSADELAGLAQLVNDGTDDFSGDEIFLTADLDLSAYSGDKGWTPIGNYDDNLPFSGTFEGGNRSLSGLFINGNDDNVGLFGYVKDGSIKELSLLNVDIGGKDVVGSIAAYGANIIISNCSATGKISGDKRVGGLIGYITGSISKVIGCFATCSTSGMDFVGGLVGYINNCEINNCYTTGEISGLGSDGGVGGLIGGSMNSQISKCYATGKVTGNKMTGGLSGYITGGKIEYSVAINFAIVCKTGTESSFGRVVGSTAGSATLDTNLGLWQMPLPDDSPSSVGDTTVNGGHFYKENLNDKDVFADPTSGLGWNFSVNPISWKMGNSSYPPPVLYWQPESSYPELPSHLE